MLKSKEPSGDTRQATQSSEPEGRIGHGSLLAGLSVAGYDAQRAQLSPRSGGSNLHFGEGPTSTAAPSVTSKPTAGPQVAAQPPVVAGAFTDPSQKDAWDYLRARAYSVAWLVALQTSLNVAPTGIPDLPTVDAILSRYPVTRLNDPKLKDQRALERQADKNRSRVHTAMAGALKALRGALPDPTLDTEAHATGLTSAGGGNGAGKDTPEDVALKDHGGYAKWVAKELKWGTFLGKPVLAHPEMHDRLANATAYLQTKYPNAKSGADLVAAIGVHTVVSFRPTTPTFDQMYHGLGFAVDLNPHQNNWQIGAGNDSWSLNKILSRANTFFGTTEVRSARGMAANAKKGTTEYAYAAIARADEQLLRYRELANDRQKLEAYFASPECPEPVRKKGMAHWAKAMKADEAWMMNPNNKLVGDPEGPKKVESPGQNVGFMDHKLETVQAMCDAGGLRWLGTGGGDASGDLMHFDGATMNTATTLRRQVDTARADLKAAKAAEAKKAEPGADKA